MVTYGVFEHNAPIFGSVAIQHPIHNPSAIWKGSVLDTIPALPNVITSFPLHFDLRFSGTTPLKVDHCDLPFLTRQIHRFFAIVGGQGGVRQKSRREMGCLNSAISL